MTTSKAVDTMTLGRGALLAPTAIEANDWRLAGQRAMLTLTAEKAERAAAFLLQTLMIEPLLHYFLLTCPMAFFSRRP